MSKQDPAYWDTGAAHPRVLVMTVGGRGVGRARGLASLPHAPELRRARFAPRAHSRLCAAAAAAAPRWRRTASRLSISPSAAWRSTLDRS